MSKECYGTCLYCRKSEETGDWVCINDLSDDYALEVDYSYKCGFIFREQNKVKPKFETSKCPICGKEFRKRKYKGKDRKYCSTRCAGIGKSPIWKYNGESLHVVEWEEKTGINAKCLLNRKDMGWDIEKILTTPISEKRGGKIDNP